MQFILILALLSLTAACGKEQSVNQPRPQSQAVDVASDNEPEHLGAALGFTYGSYTYTVIGGLNREGINFSTSFKLSQDPNSDLVEVYYMIPKRVKSPDVQKMRARTGCGVINGNLRDLKPIYTSDISVKDINGSPMLYTKLEGVVPLLSTCKGNEAVMVFEHYKPNMVDVEARIIVGMTLPPSVSRY